MAKTNLVIVESPSKASTIKGYLGSNYKVIASVGHVRDLPKSTLGVDIDNNFAAHYINIRGKGDIIKEIKKEAKNAGKVFLATDPDREGEAISWIRRVCWALTRFMSMGLGCLMAALTTGLVTSLKVTR